MSKLIEVESPIVEIGRMIGPRTLPVIAAMIGGAVFSAIIGGTVVDPAKLGWVVSGDASTGYLGWLFFRLAPWAWPPGALHASGLDHAGSLVAAGSIPLLAFFFKLVARFLPGNFQYIGLWLFACYVLQGFFAYRLLALFTRRFAVLFGGVLLFLLSPVLLARAQTDPALAAQWIVLAALYLYYSSTDRDRPIAWLVLLWLATLVQGYFALMVLAICLAHALQRRKPVFKFVALIAAAVAGAVTLMWLAGYFMPPFTSTGRFGFNSMNALAPFLPVGGRSFRMHAPAMAFRGQFEGFNYLGLGILVALVVAMATSRSRRTQHADMGARITTSDKGVVLACIVLTILALSDVVTWGPHRLFSLPLGESFASGMNAIGASGRFFWPAYYLLILAAVRGLLRLPARAIGPAMLAVVVLQLFDLSPYLHATRRDFATRAQDEGFPSVDSPFWLQARGRYGHLHLAASNADVSLMNSYRYVAGLHGFIVDPSNEVATSAVGAEVQQRDNELSLGHFEPNSIYLVSFETLQKLQRNPALFPPSTGMGIIDGLAIVAPGWFDAAGGDYLHHQGSIDYQPIALNRNESFAKGGDAAALLASGWGDPENDGFSSVGTPSTIAFHAPDATGDLRMVFNVLPYLPAPFPRLGVDVLINGRRITHWSFDSGRAKPTTTLVIPSALLAQQKNLQMSFVFDSPRSPLEARASADPRKLAIFVRSMRLQPAKAPISMPDASD